METIKAISEFIENNFNKFIVGIISWGSLLFFNLTLATLIDEIYPANYIKIDNGIFWKFLSVFLVVGFVFTVLSLFLSQRNPFLSSIIVTIIFNMTVTIAPLNGQLPFYEKMMAFFVTDTFLAIWIAIHLHPMKDLFVTKEIKKSYEKGEMHIEETTKSYPIVLPIIVAIIGASGAIISAMIK